MVRGLLCAFVFSFLAPLTLTAGQSPVTPAEAPPPVPPPPPDDLPAAPIPPVAPAPPAPPAAAPAPDMTPAAATPAAPTEDVPALPAAPAPQPATGEEGKTAQISGGRVNLRAGPGTSYEIITTVNEKTPVSVFSKSGEWVKISFPESESCYVHQDFIEGNIPADIPEAGLEAVVKGDQINIRVRPWDKSSIVGQMNKGDKIQITGLRGPWAKIKPPASSRAWVFEKYLLVEGQIAVDSAAGEPPPPPPDAQAKKKSNLAEELGSRRSELAEEYRLRQEARIEAEEKKLDKIVEDTAREVEKLEEEIRQQQESITPAVIRDELEKTQLPGGEKHVGGFSGWIEYIGWLGKRPAAFRLVQGEETVFFLRSVKHDLRNYVNRRVSLDGLVETAPGFEANVLLVETVRVLGEAPAPVRDRMKEENNLPEEEEFSSSPVTEPAPRKRKNPEPLQEESKPKKKDSAQKDLFRED